MMTVVKYTTLNLFNLEFLIKFLETLHIYIYISVLKENISVVNYYNGIFMSICDVPVILLH